MGKTGSPGREEDQHHQKLGLVSILAVGTLFLFIGYHLGGHDDHTTKRTSFAGTYAGRRGQRGPAESVGTDDKIGSAYPSSIKPVTMPDYVPDYTNENCKSIKNHPFGRACPAPLEVEATQREAAEKSLAKLPWIKVLEETPKMKTDSEGNLIVEDWNPPENFMSDWAKKAVKDALLPWNSYIDPFQIESYSVRAKGRGGCSLRIRNGNAAGCTGGGTNGRYETLIKEALQHLKKQGEMPKDSRIITSKGDDEPTTPMMPDKASISLPLVVSQQNNGRFYDFVMPTITRKAFLGSGYYNEGLRLVKNSKPFEEREDGLIWRGSPGCSYGCGPLGKYFYPDRNRGEACGSSKGWSYSPPKYPPESDGILDASRYSQKCREHPRAMLVGYSEKHPTCVDAQLTGKSHKGNFVSFNDFKFVVNVGNNGFADRVKILLSMGNVIFFHTSGWKEWYYTALVPWVHYVPVMHDFSDLCEKHELLSRNPEAAAAISRNAQRFFKDCLRPSDKNTYVGELLLQWGELWDKLVTQRTLQCPLSDDVAVDAACMCSADLSDRAEGPNCYHGQYCIDGKGIPLCITK